MNIFAVSNDKKLARKNKGDEMKIFDELKIGKLRSLFELDNITYQKALPFIQQFRDENNLTDKESLEAFSMAKKLFSKELIK